MCIFINMHILYAWPYWIWLFCVSLLEVYTILIHTLVGQVLSDYNKIVFLADSEEDQALLEHEKTDEEVTNCFLDLRVLGKGRERERERERVWERCAHVHRLDVKLYMYDMKANWSGRHRLPRQREKGRETGRDCIRAYMMHTRMRKSPTAFLTCMCMGMGEREREREREKERERDSLRARMHICSVEMHIYQKFDEGSCHKCFLDLRVLGRGRKRERERKKDSIGANMNIGTRWQWGCELSEKERNHMFSDYLVHTILIILCTRDHHTYTHFIDILARCVHILSVQAYKKDPIADYRVAKTHRMPYIHRSFCSKEPYNQWLFCEKWPAT